MAPSEEQMPVRFSPEGCPLFGGRDAADQTQGAGDYRQYIPKESPFSTLLGSEYDPFIQGVIILETPTQNQDII